MIALDAPPPPRSPRVPEHALGLCSAGPTPGYSDLLQGPHTTGGSTEPRQQ